MGCNRTKCPRIASVTLEHPTCRFPSCGDLSVSTAKTTMLLAHDRLSRAERHNHDGRLMPVQLPGADHGVGPRHVEKTLAKLGAIRRPHLEDGPDGIAVTFGDGSRRRYALVFGCDGNRSTTRGLAFGETDDFSSFMGGYFFIKVVPTTKLLPANLSQIFSVPGRTALLNGYDDQTHIVLALRNEREIDYYYRDRAQQRRMIHDHFDGLGWKVPAMLDHVDADDEFYFDKVSQIRMPV
jgi:hypothetical protein